MRAWPLLLAFMLSLPVQAADLKEEIEALEHRLYKTTGRVIYCSSSYPLADCKKKLESYLKLDWSRAKITRKYITNVLAFAVPEDSVNAPLLIDSAAPPGPVMMSLPATDLQALKAAYEKELSSKTGSRVTCIHTDHECIAWYDRALTLDWSKSPLGSDWTLLVGKEQSIKDKTVSFDLDDDLEAVTAFLNLDLKSAIRDCNLSHSSASEVIKMESGAGGKCEDGGTNIPVPAANPDRSCPEQARFYDKLFSESTFRITIALGYEGLWNKDFSYEYPGFSSDRKSFDELIGNLKSFNGFQVVSKSSTEAVLERKFLYRGNTKTARVHIVRSTVQCPGEVSGGRRTRGPEGKLSCPEQVKASDRAVQVFRSALRKNHFVMYNGHSRLGRGPEFGPHDTKRWQITPAELRKIKPEVPQAVINFASCKSAAYYQECMKDTGAAFISNEGLSYMDNGIVSARRNVAALLEARCSDEIGAILDHQKVVQDDADFKTIVRGFE